jgi:RNA polymerase sigma-70 factor, ECF subfamily
MQNINNQKDEEIVKIVQTKDPEAYTHLVERYQTKLVRYVTYLTRDGDLAEDVVQDTFIKGFINIKGFDTQKKFSSWIYRIAHNEAVNKIKRQSRLVSMGDLADIFGSKESIEEEFEKEDTKRILRENLDKISVRYSEPLILHFLEEKSYEEISDILRMPMGTVGTRINRGKKLLKEVYEQTNK